MPSPQMQLVIEALRQRQAARTDQPARTLDEIRAGYAPAGQLVPLPEDVLVTAVDAGGVRAYWLDAPGVDAQGVLVFVHGGGFTLGSLRSHGPLAARLGRATRRRVIDSISRRTAFCDLGADYHTTRINKDRKTRNLIHQLEALGHTVTLNPAA